VLRSAGTSSAPQIREGQVTGEGVWSAPGTQQFSCIKPARLPLTTARRTKEELYQLLRHAKYYRPFAVTENEETGSSQASSGAGVPQPAGQRRGSALQTEHRAHFCVIAL